MNVPGDLVRRAGQTPIESEDELLFASTFLVYLARQFRVYLLLHVLSEAVVQNVRTGKGSLKRVFFGILK